MIKNPILKYSIYIIIIFLVLFGLAILTNTTAKINNYISIRSFDTTCVNNSDCNLVSPGCPGTCLPCDQVICAKGSWRDRVCPLPTIHAVACATCPSPDFHCECVNNRCQKTKNE